MLVLSRKDNEQITIGDDIVITIISTGANSVRIGVSAPKSISVRRRAASQRAGDDTRKAAPEAIAEAIHPPLLHAGG